MITVIANLKGGSGKSTVAFNLGVWLLKKGHPVAAYDLDPQMTLSDVATVRREEGYSPPLQVYLAQDALAEHLKYHPGEVIVDVGVANMDRMKEAIGVADRVIVPVPPSQPDVWATQRFIRMIEASLNKHSPPEITAFVNRADTHHAVRESDEAHEALSMLPGLNVSPHRLYQRTVFRRSLSEGLAVFEIWPNCKAAKEVDVFASSLYPEIANVKTGK